MENRQVVIVGGGPAGSFLAYHLARGGLDVVLLERWRMPRPKPCGGGITLKTAALLGAIPWRDAVEDSTDKATVVYHRRTSLSWPQPVCFMVRRERFDHLLLQAARDAGAQVVEGAQVIGMTADAEWRTVHLASGGKVSGKLVVGADGAQSVVARDFRRRLKQGAGLVAEVYPGPEGLVGHQGSIWVDLTAVPAGYGWFFPKSDHLNVGIVSFTGGTTGLQALMDGFLGRLGLAGEKTRKRRGFPLPFHYLVQKTVTGPRTLVLGDAAGLCDPFTGEGVYQACYTATLAAEAILSRRSRLESVPDLYQRMVDRHLGREMILAQRVAWAFYGMTGWAARFLEHHTELMLEFWTYLYTDSYRRLWKTMGRRFRSHILGL